MKITKREHIGYKEFRSAKKKGFELRNLFGRFQYLYEHNHKKISLVFLKESALDGIDFWEIWDYDSGLFEGVERFGTKQQAEKRIKEIFKIKDLKGGNLNGNKRK